ncbi:MAG: DTW domain-containing protein [Halobacteriovoraceae bacterium]|jgi:DTW domain-containing protein|nr:DTW domain-containing protein [Halobacteriovoraceae bacterium]
MSTTRRDTRIKRCPKCLVHHLNCFCNDIETLSLKSKLSLIIYKKERFLPSNTAQLTLKSLTNSQYFFRGYQGKKLNPDFIDDTNYQPLLLFPTEDSVELTPELVKTFNKPINLIVPDGTWRQAKKVHRREELLINIPRVRITPQAKSIYPLRRQKFEFGLCTHEAIAYAMAIIESENVKNKLMNNLKIFIHAHLKNRPIFEKEN